LAGGHLAVKLGEGRKALKLVEATLQMAPNRLAGLALPEG